MLYGELGIKFRVKLHVLIIFIPVTNQQENFGNFKIQNVFAEKYSYHTFISGTIADYERIIRLNKCKDMHAAQKYRLNMYVWFQ